MDKIEAEDSVALITRANGKPMVMMTLEEFEGMRETEYLMHSPENAEVLRRSLRDAAEGKTTKMSAHDFKQKMASAINKAKQKDVN